MKSFILLLSLLLSLQAMAQDALLFVGTYSNTGSKGIYVFRFDTETGELTPTYNTNGEVNGPGFLSLSADGQYLYAGTDAKADSSYISAFKIDTANGKLEFLDRQYSGGKNAIYLSVNPQQTFVAAVNYFSGTLAVFPRKSKGNIMPYTQLIQFEGSSINPDRQTESHPHSAVFSPDGKQLFVPDLGSDKIWVFNFDNSTTEPLTAADPPFIAVEPGSGPRHLVFHPNGSFAYLVSELSGTIDTYAYGKGTLTFVSRQVLHPRDIEGPYGSADIHVAPDGRYIVASNRGKQNNLVSFYIDQGSGKPVVSSGQVPSGGETPRNFCISRDGAWVIVANQNSDNIEVFERQPNLGILKPTKQRVSVPQPTCVILSQP